MRESSVDLTPGEIRGTAGNGEEGQFGTHEVHTAPASVCAATKELASLTIGNSNRLVGWLREMDAVRRAIGTAA